jgi:hypothetical protein
MILTCGKESSESIAQTAGMSGNQPNGDGVDESPNGKLSWLQWYHRCNILGPSDHRGVLRTCNDSETRSLSRQQGGECR